MHALMLSSSAFMISGPNHALGRYFPHFLTILVYLMGMFLIEFPFTAYKLADEGYDVCNLILIVTLY